MSILYISHASPYPFLSLVFAPQMSYILGAELTSSALHTLNKYTPLFVKSSAKEKPKECYFVRITDKFGHICVQTILHPSLSDFGNHYVTEYNTQQCTFYEANSASMDDPISHVDLEW